MPWNYIQAEIIPEQRCVRPLVGAGGMSREQAHAEVQALLDRLPHFATQAAIWRRGAKDNTVYAGPFIWCLYEHPEGDDPRRGAVSWLEDFAAAIRATGQKMQVERLP